MGAHRQHCTGKSTVLTYLAAKGAHVVDADKLAHRAMAPDGPTTKVIALRSGRTLWATTYGSSVAPSWAQSFSTMPRR
ncbi:MAG: dephospho-CoA kinase [Caldilineaceae bacterium]